MKNFLLIFIFFLIVFYGCTTLKDDPSQRSDFHARYQSVGVLYDGVFSAGPRVIVVDEKSDLEKDVILKTIFNGTYSVRSDSCSFFKEGRYDFFQDVSFKIKDVFNEFGQDKTCDIFISMNVDNPERAEHPVSPRYSVIFLVFSTYDETLYFHDQIMEGMPLKDRFYGDENSLGEYKVIQKCLEDDAVTLGPFVLNGKLSLNEVTYDLDTNRIDTCYNSVLINDRGSFVKIVHLVNIFNRSHNRLLIHTSFKDDKIHLNGPDFMYYCGIGDKMWTTNEGCYWDLDKLPTGFVIQVHTNKRSFYDYIAR